jgi:dihydroorotase-like cyclic amidohydrolase
MVGLETALALLLALVRDGHVLGALRFVEVLRACARARRAPAPGARSGVGERGDVALLAPARRWTRRSRETIRSKQVNSPVARPRSWSGRARRRSSVARWCSTRMSATQ